MFACRIKGSEYCNECIYDPINFISVAATNESGAYEKN